MLGVAQMLRYVIIKRQTVFQLQRALAFSGKIYGFIICKYIKRILKNRRRSYVLIMSFRYCLFLLRPRIQRSCVGRRLSSLNTSSFKAGGKHMQEKKMTPNTIFSPDHFVLQSAVVTQNGGRFGFHRTFATSVCRTEAIGQVQSTHYHLVYTCKVRLYCNKYE